jgi:hypothetical protein
MPGRPGTGGLGGTGSLQKDELAELGAALKTAAEDPETRNKLKDLLIRVRDLEASLSPLRGDAVGELCIDIEDAAASIRQIAGKVYYINRVLTNLGPLGEKMVWCSDAPDPAVERIMAAAEGSAEAAGGNAQQQVQIAGRLRSLFKS